MKVPEKFRIKKGPYGSTEKEGNNGAFDIFLSMRSRAIVIASDGEGWEHVSVHIISDGVIRTPTWAEMCRIKDMFWEEKETVVQFHPKKSEYINTHKHTLHLWKKIGEEYELPKQILV